MQASKESPVRSVLPLLRGSDWHQPGPSQMRYLSKVFGFMRGIAALAVLGLAALLVQPSSKLGVVALILFVATYDSLALLAFYRASDRAIVNIARVVGLVDVISFFAMLWLFGPSPPGALIACYIALTNVAVALDGLVGASASAVLFIAGYTAFEAMRSYVYRLSFQVNDVVLWCVVVAIIAISLSSIQGVLVSAQIGARGAEDSPRGPAPILHLSPREQEVLALVAEGYSNTMIANRLRLSDNTVKGYVETLLTRLNARNRAEAVAAASRLKLL